jgi:hypothetical protein
MKKVQKACCFVSLQFGELLESSGKVGKRRLNDKSRDIFLVCHPTAILSLELGISGSWLCFRRHPNTVPLFRPKYLRRFVRFHARA